MKKDNKHALFLQVNPMEKPEKGELLTRHSDGYTLYQKGLLEPSTWLEVAPVSVDGKKKANQYIETSLLSSLNRAVPYFKSWRSNDFHWPVRAEISSKWDNP